MSLVSATKAALSRFQILDMLKMQNFVNRSLRDVNTFSSVDAGGGFIADLTTCKLVVENKKRSSLTCLMGEKWVLVDKRQKWVLKDD